MSPGDQLAAIAKALWTLRQLLDQPLPPEGQAVGLAGLAGKVVAFVWVIAEAEQLFTAISSEPDIFFPPASQAMIIWRVFDMQKFAPSGILTAHKRQQ